MCWLYDLGRVTSTYLCLDFFPCKMGTAVDSAVQECYWDPRWLLLVSHSLRASFSADLVCTSISVAVVAYFGYIFWTSHMTGLENRTAF